MEVNIRFQVYCFVNVKKMVEDLLFNSGNIKNHFKEIFLIIRENVKENLKNEIIISLVFFFN